MRVGVRVGVGAGVGVKDRVRVGLEGVDGTASPILYRPREDIAHVRDLGA